MVEWHGMAAWWHDAPASGRPLRAKKNLSHTGGSTSAPTEMELELQLTPVGLQPTAVGCNRRRRGSYPKGRPLSKNKKITVPKGTS